MDSMVEEFHKRETLIWCMFSTQVFIVDCKEFPGFKYVSFQHIYFYHLNLTQNVQHFSWFIYGPYTPNKESTENYYNLFGSRNKHIYEHLFEIYKCNEK